MTTSLAPAPEAAGPAARFRRTGSDFLSEATRAARVNRVRAREARSMATACEQRARRAPGQSAMYLREALRLRREAAALDVDAALHEEAVTALRQLTDDGLLPRQGVSAEPAGRL
ncbi:hypothetical protein [Sporichthya sp.]|uniref:hypothetical protein n=1 Tax=Sporichthya sp. TaxID=65475 RepID=UPI00183BD0A3|nr:hypothetical protein [Sporichthya sp.]MBA3742798.1 hypothetical protein [Sporichthya sp.]